MAVFFSEDFHHPQAEFSSPSQTVFKNIPEDLQNFFSEDFHHPQAEFSSPSQTVFKNIPEDLQNMFFFDILEENEDVDEEQQLSVFEEGCNEDAHRESEEVVEKQLSVFEEGFYAEELLSHSSVMKCGTKNCGIRMAEGEVKKRKAVAFTKDTLEPLPLKRIPLSKGEISPQMNIQRERKVAVVEGSKAPLLQPDLKGPTISTSKAEIIPVEMNIEGEQPCHKMRDDFPYEVVFRGYRFNLVVSEKSNTFGGSRPGSDKTLLFRLNNYFMPIDMEKRIEVSTRDMSNCRLLNFKLDLSDPYKEEEAELTLRLVFLFLKIAFPTCKTFENCAHAPTDRHRACKSQCFRAFFKRIDFFQADKDLAMQQFQPSLKKAFADFHKYFDALPFDHEFISRYRGVKRKP